MACTSLKLPPLNRPPSKKIKIGRLPDWLRIFKNNHMALVFVREMRVAMDVQSLAQEAISLRGHRDKLCLSGETMELLSVAEHLAGMNVIAGHAQPGLADLLKYHESVSLTVEHLGTPAGREALLEAVGKRTELFIDNPECRATENEKAILREIGLWEYKLESETIWAKFPPVKA